MCFCHAVAFWCESLIGLEKLPSEVERAFFDP